MAYRRAGGAFYAKKYEHLQLSGFYWFTEEIDYEDSQLLEMIRVTTDYVRSKNLITTWIPYYLASGYNDWRRLGFDMACYQPNYAFSQGIPEQRLYDAADTAKLLGMCIELEIGGLENGTLSTRAITTPSARRRDTCRMRRICIISEV